MNEFPTVRSLATRARGSAAALGRRARRALPEREHAVPLPPSIRIVSPRDTLTACAWAIESNEVGAYLRFGDGCVNLLRNLDTIDQRASRELSVEIRETFELGGRGILKGLPLHSPRFGIWPGMRPGVHGSSDEWTERLLQQCYPYFIGTPIYSAIALAYCAVFDPPPAFELLRLVRARTSVFVGNSEIPRAVVARLFGDAAHVTTPARDSYAELDRIEADVVQVLEGIGGRSVVTFAIGNAGRALAKRLVSSESSVFCFDFGSLIDALCGWNTRAWIELVDFDANRFLAEL